MSDFDEQYAFKIRELYYQCLKDTIDRNLHNELMEITWMFFDNLYKTLYKEDIKGCFDLKKITKKAEPKIMERVGLFKSDIKKLPLNVLYHILQGYYYEDFEYYEPKPTQDEIKECYKIDDQLRNLFFTDLYIVLSIPIKLACDLNKGEYPNGDLSCGHEIQTINFDSNLSLFTIAFQQICACDELFKTKYNKYAEDRQSLLSRNI